MSVYESLLKPLLFRVPPEKAHAFGAAFLRAGLGLAPLRKAVRKRTLKGGPGAVERFGIEFPNALGVAAGFDKNGKLAAQLSAIGFGFVEVGTVTFEPQPGNPGPRLFRLPEDEALINRLGFNNEGAKAVCGRLENILGECVLGVNIGKNKDVPNSDAVRNYLNTFELVRPVADYIVVNVSSPNTPGLRDLQEAGALDELLAALQEANQGSQEARPLLLKIAPDLGEEAVVSAVEIAEKRRFAGLIATNTTISREGLRTSRARIEEIGAGGLSGRPLARRSTEVVSIAYSASGGRLPIIGVGGIFSAQDAFDKIASGASLVQAYTGFVYRGPAFAREINRGLATLLQERGFSSVDEAVGTAVGHQGI